MARGGGKGSKGGKGKGAGRSAHRPLARRDLTVKVRTAKRRPLSSTRWLQRQLNDPYVAEAKARGFRSRAAFKLIDIDEKFSLLKPGLKIVDLGAAPGGWTQVALERLGGSGLVVAVDLQEMDPVGEAVIIHGDMEEEAVAAQVRAALGGPADLVLSDMAARATGHANTDHLRTLGLAESACALACELLRPGGDFAAKVLQGGAQGELLDTLKRAFATVKHFKPPASRSESAEMYVVARGFRPAA